MDGARCWPRSASNVSTSTAGWLTPVACGARHPATPGSAAMGYVGMFGTLLARPSRQVVAVGHEVMDLLPAGVVGEQHRDAITAGSRGEERVANGQAFLAFVWAGM